MRCTDRWTPWASEPGSTAETADDSGVSLPIGTFKSRQVRLSPRVRSESATAGSPARLANATRDWMTMAVK